MKIIKNRKYLFVFFIIALISTMFLFTSCENNNIDYNIDYKSLEGYEEYISDSDKGYEDLPFFNVVDSMEESEEAREYFIANSRQCGDYIITDYEDGVCINKYTRFIWNSLDEITINIPETLAGKPVVKIGGYLKYDDIGYGEEEIVVCAFGGFRNCTLNLPKTLKVITKDSIRDYIGMIPEDTRDNYVEIQEINVDENNPYYSSKDGELYSKDMKKLLFAYFGIWSSEYKVPDFVETFEPALGVPSGLTSIEIGKNVKNINTYIDRDEDGLDWVPDIIVSGYKNTAAEKWAKQENVKFEALD